MNEFKALREANIARDAQWDPENKISLSFRGNELAGEVGEACNQLKKADREKLGLRGSAFDIDKLAEELADVVICADLAAMELGIPLWDEVKKKFNKTSNERGLSMLL